MQRFLILKLDGVLQAWGAHTFEDYRPSHAFPTLSGLLGLLGACLGIDRCDARSQQDLAESIDLAVRADRRRISEDDGFRLLSSTRLTDFHTIRDARKVGGKRNEYPVVSRREYLCDAPFTVAIGQRSGAAYSLEQIAAAVKRPVYTPGLGRRSCPPTRPLFECFVEAEGDVVDALSGVEPHGGIVYAETANSSPQKQRIRDRPIFGRPRQFASRYVGIHANTEEPT
jgi:CRISPR system Cascade subunit CasD